MEPVMSPCINICRLDEQQVCIGCGRTAVEIAEWLGASERRRAAIRHAASLRLKYAPQPQRTVSHE
jgi:uncharacterized protein